MDTKRMLAAVLIILYYIIDNNSKSLTCGGVMFYSIYQSNSIHQAFTIGSILLNLIQLY